MSGADSGLERLLEHIRTSRGLDLTGYKTASLQRRLRKRMDVLSLAGYEDYLDHLEADSGEFDHLLNTILINVTSFFRDPEAWEAIASEVLPAIIAAKGADAPIRIWSAGSASGEEAYTIAILLAEALGPDELRRRVKIYGTDIDDDALEQARFGIYDAAGLEAVPETLRARYFERAGPRWCFRKDLRRVVVFGRNNLVHDAPISRVDLLACRNTLMYFNTETQAQVLRRLHFALQPTGFLFLGKAEMLLTRRELFQPVDSRRRIFTKVERPADRRPAPPVLPLQADGRSRPQPAEIVERAIDAAVIPQIVVARDLTLLLVNDAARHMLRVGTPDLGRPLQDLEVSYRPAELRPALDAAFNERRDISLGPVTHRHGGEEREFEIRVRPLPGEDVVDAVSVAFLDVTERRRAEREIERARMDLATAYAELQSTVEELETTNEELQSSNEELETMNEELQSTNEELQTMNDELRLRSHELREANAFMEAILDAKGVGVAVIDRDERIRAWNGESEELWGLRTDEVIGSQVADLDIGLPVSEFMPAVRRAFTDGGGPVAIEVNAIDRRGRAFTCSVSVVPLSVDAGDVAGAIVLAERSESTAVV